MSPEHRNVGAEKMNQPGAALSLKQVSKRYAVGPGEELVAVNAVSLEVDPGSTVALVGASGSGKSTLLHLVGAMDAPTEGTVTVDGVVLAELNARRLARYRNNVGFVFQRFHLLPALTVLDNVLAPLLPYQVAFDRRARARELLEAVGLAGREGSLPSRLSGGQQQRVALARALINHPQLLLADEPTGNLDSRTGDEVLDLLFDLHESTGMTVIVATHDPQVAARCGRILRLRDGVVIEDRQVGRRALV